MRGKRSREESIIGYGAGESGRIWLGRGQGRLGNERGGKGRGCEVTGVRGAEDRESKGMIGVRGKVGR